MPKEPEDLGKKVDEVDGICAICPFNNYPLSEYVLYDCKLGKDDCIHRGKIFYDSFFSGSGKVIILAEELRDFIPAQL